MLSCEVDLDAPMRLLDGSNVTGAQSLFDAIHPVVTGGSVNMEDIEIDWKQGSPRKPAEDIHKLRANYVLTSSSPPDRRVSDLTTTPNSRLSPPME